MSSHGQTYEAFAQIPGKGWELWWLWSDVNQRILRELVTFSTGAAKEGIRLSAEIQLAAVEAVKDGQTFLLQRQAELPDAPKDPVGWYQRSVLESVDGMQKALKLVEGTTQAVTRSAERVPARRRLSRRARADRRFRRSAEGGRHGVFAGGAVDGSHGGYGRAHSLGAAGRCGAGDGRLAEGDEPSVLRPARDGRGGAGRDARCDRRVRRRRAPRHGHAGSDQR